MICELCSEEIPFNHVQQGGLHIDCCEKEIEVYKICNDGTYYYSEYLPSDYNDYEITLEKMIAGKFYNLKEFEGF